MTDSADRVEFSPEALAELDDVVAYISERNPGAGERVLAAIMRTLATLAAPNPCTDGREATLDTGERCRRSFVTPVVIFYQRGPGLVAVLHVWHHAREPIAR